MPLQHSYGPKPQHQTLLKKEIDHYIPNDADSRSIPCGKECEKMIMDRSIDCFQDSDSDTDISPLNSLNPLQTITSEANQGPCYTLVHTSTNEKTGVKEDLKKIAEHVNKSLCQLHVTKPKTWE